MSRPHWPRLAVLLPGVAMLATSLRLPGEGIVVLLAPKSGLDPGGGGG